MRDRLNFLFLNVGHFLDHLFMLVYATVAALALSREWGMSYAELVPYATPGFIAFGVFSLPMGWLADRWSREGMMAVFFVGTGLASIATAFASTPLMVGLGLFVIGVFAAIYHPVGLAIVVQDIARFRGAIALNIALIGGAAAAAIAYAYGWGKLAYGGWPLGLASLAIGIAFGALLLGPLVRVFQAGTSDRSGMAIAVNGVFGNLGVASAALVTGYFIDHGGWRTAFVWPGMVSIAIGIGYAALKWTEITHRAAGPKAAAAAGASSGVDRALLIRISLIIFATAALSSFMFQSTTFALPKVFDERLRGIAGSATMLGWLAFVVFALASLAQLVVGSCLDRVGPRTVFLIVSAVQVVFFSIMPGLSDWAALLVALAFMLAVFGQIPINDYMIGRMAKSELRASIYGARYIVSFVSLAASLPVIAWVHKSWGFDRLFLMLAIASAAIFAIVLQLPRKLPEAGAAQAPARARA